MADDQTPDASADMADATDETPPANDEVAKWKALARKHEKQSKELSDRLREREDADKTELQKLQESIAERDAQLSDLPRQVRSQAIRFASKATQAGFLDPEDALTFLADDIDLGDDAAVDAALKELAGRKPHLLRSDPKPRVAARPKPPSGDASSEGGLPKGKERAAAALRQFRNT